MTGFPPFGKTARGVAMWRGDLAQGKNSVFLVRDMAHKQELVTRFALTDHEAQHVQVLKPNEASFTEIYGDQLTGPWVHDEVILHPSKE